MFYSRLDFSKMKVCSSFARLSAEESRALEKLVGPALQVEESEAGGGVICWGRKKYVWQQQTTDSSLASNCARCQSLENNAFRLGNRDYFGERMLACVLMSRLCFSTTRRSSPSMVLNASWMTFLSGS